MDVGVPSGPLVDDRAAVLAVIRAADQVAPVPVDDNALPASMGEPAKSDVVSPPRCQFDTHVRLRGPELRNGESLITALPDRAGMRNPIAG